MWNPSKYYNRKGFERGSNGGEEEVPGVIGDIRTRFRIFAQKRPVLVVAGKIALGGLESESNVVSFIIEDLAIAITSY